jgi:hypothetical protein
MHTTSRTEVAKDLVAVLGQEGPAPEDHVRLTHANEAGAIGLVVDEVAKSCREMPSMKPTMSMTTWYKSGCISVCFSLMMSYAMSFAALVMLVKAWISLSARTPPSSCHY